MDQRCEHGASRSLPVEAIRPDALRRTQTHSDALRRSQTHSDAITHLRDAVGIALRRTQTHSDALRRNHTPARCGRDSATR